MFLRLSLAFALFTCISSQGMQCSPGEKLSGFTRLKAGEWDRVSFSCAAITATEDDGTETTTTAATTTSMAEEDKDTYDEYGDTGDFGAPDEEEEEETPAKPPAIDGPYATFNFDGLSAGGGGDEEGGEEKAALQGLKMTKSEKPLQCMDMTENEGCVEPNSWLCGFEMFETGPGSEIYFPYCCTADNVRIREDKCKRRSINKRYRPAAFEVKEEMMWKYISCHFVQADFEDGTSEIQDTIFFATQCPYRVSAPKAKKQRRKFKYW